MSLNHPNGTFKPILKINVKMNELRKLDFQFRRYFYILFILNAIDDHFVMTRISMY